MSVLTSPLGLIKKDGVTVGLMKDITVTETIRRIPVRGIGALTPSEVPATEWDGRLTCSFYMIDLTKNGIPDAIKRDTNSVQQWVDNVLLQDVGVDLVLFKKEKDSVNQTTGDITPQLTEIGTVRNLFVTSDGFNLSDGQISGRSQEFVYITPLLENV